MPSNLLDRLEQWKRRYGDGDTSGLLHLLDEVGRRRFRDASSVVRLHETLLFFRAYPHSLKVAKKAETLLSDFSSRIAGDSACYEEPEVSGIAGTSFSAIFSFEVVRSLSVRYPDSIDVDWERYEPPPTLGHALTRSIPMFKEDWPVEAHVPFHAWIDSVRRPAQTSLQWLLANVRDPAAFDALQVPVRWTFADTHPARTSTRLPAKRLFVHEAPLIRRSDVSLALEMEGPELSLQRLSRAEAQSVLDLILDTSAVRYRELYGFTNPDCGHVYRADAGRGVEIVLFGVPPASRLPLRAYHAAMFFKNGIPAGYVEVLSLFERAEVGFNLYYTFREGETAWIYARLLRLFRQVLGVTTFSIDPYQIGHENEEAIDSGAFWFYRKLGFRPVEPAIARLVEREERGMRSRPGYRSSPATLRKLASGPIVFEGPGSEPGAWDAFSIRKAAMRLAQAPGPAALRRVLRLKMAPEEWTYLRALQQQPRLRTAILSIGSR